MTAHRPVLLRAAIGASSALLALGVAGCSGSGGGAVPAEAAVTATPTPPTAHPTGTVIRVRITADSVSPAGTRVPVAAGKPVTLLIDATAAGELHVHSTPEQHIEYPKGSSAVSLSFDQPGIVEIESHALEKTIVQLEVR